MIYFSACGTRSGILFYIFSRMECAVVFCVKYLPAFLFISCFIILNFILFLKFACLNLSWIYALWYCIISCYIFLRLERDLVLCNMILHVERALVLWNFVLYFSACGTRYGIVEFCDIFLCVWNALKYCVISCYIFPRVECALVLYNFVLYFSIY